MTKDGLKGSDSYQLSIAKYLKQHGFGQSCPKAVLFDMDGVIYDSMPNHARAWHESMASFGLEIGPDGVYQYEGMRGVETIKLLARQQWQREVGDAEAERMYAEKSRLFNACPPAPVMPGIRELMEQMKADGLKLCVVTGSGQHTLLDKLLTDFEGLLSRDLMVTAFDVSRGKPDPEPYLTGMKKTGTAPWETIVVENAPLGVRAAVAARCFTIAVNTGPLSNRKLTAEGANLVFGSMTGLSEQWARLQVRPIVSQDTRWEQHYAVVSDYIQRHHRLPSKHRIEDHRMLNWLKYNKKRIAVGELPAERLAKFNQLMAMAEKYHKVNQYSYVTPPEQELEIF